MQDNQLKQNKNQNSNQNKKSMTVFLILLAGQFISAIGSGLTDFGLAIYVLDLTHSITATSLISVCAFLPAIVLTPVGGILADRYDRRLMMLIGELGSGAALVLSLLTIMSSNPSFPLLLVSVGISSVFTALTEPAFKATITDLVSEEDFAKAGGLVQIAGNAKLLISPVIAGLLLQITPVSTLIVIDIMTFFTTVFTISFVRKNLLTKKTVVVITPDTASEAKPDTTPEITEKRVGFVKEMKEGLQALKNAQGIWTLVWIMTLSVFCLGSIQILSKPLVLAYATESQLGTLTTVVAMGMLAGSILVSCGKKEKNLHRFLSFGLMGCGIFMALMGIWQNLYLTAVFGFLMFTCMPAVQIAAEVMVRKNLPNEVQGRAFGVIGFVSQMGYIAAYLATGFLSDYVTEPLMKGNSGLAQVIGSVIGRGTGRGVALLVILSGVLLVCVSLLVLHSKKIHTLSNRRS